MDHASMTWFEYLDSWHEFYLMAGTAAVTLAGLLFVAISLHVDALVHDSREHLLALARATLFSFVMVLVLSLMMLVPHQPMKVVGVELIVLSLVVGRINLSLTRWKPRVDHPGFSAAAMRRRQILPLIGYAIVMLAGVGLLVTGVPDMMKFTIGAVCLLLGNAAGASWDLLVRMAKVKQES